MSTSPAVSSSARLQSIIPAPVASRSSLTSDALIVVLTPTHPFRHGGRLELGLGLGAPSAAVPLQRHRSGRRLRRHLGRGHLRPAGSNAVGDDPGDEVARPDRVVVAGDDVLRLVRIGVRVDEADDGHAEPMRLANRELLLLQVEDEDGVRLALHVRDAAEVRLELLEVGLHREPLLRRQQLELPVGLQAAEVVEVARCARRSCASS